MFKRKFYNFVIINEEESDALYHFVLFEYYFVTSKLRMYIYIYIYAKIMHLNMQKST